MSLKALASCSGRCCCLSKCKTAFIRSTYRRTACKRRKFSAHPASAEQADQRTLGSDGTISTMGQKAKEKMADREFFFDLLSSAATKRDAKSYLSRLIPPRKSTSDPDPSRPQSDQSQLSQALRPQCKPGSFFGPTRAVEESPTFSQSAEIGVPPEQMEETLHVALVKLVAPELLDDQTLQGIGQTLSQLSRLSMSPCVIIDTETPPGTAKQDWKSHLFKESDRMVAAIDANRGPGARRLDNIFALSESTGIPEVLLRKLLVRPLQQGLIPVILPLAYSDSTQTACQISAEDAILALTREFAGLNLNIAPEQPPQKVAEQCKSLQKQASLERIIILHQDGAFPRPGRHGQKHVFVNLDQEYESIKNELSSPQQLKILKVLRDALMLLPPSSSALITTPSDAAKSSDSSRQSMTVSSVGTRRKRNALIHNILTDKPAHSSSLPMGRLGRGGPQAPPLTPTSTFVKKGMPLTILPDPNVSLWIPQNYSEARLKLTDPRIDLPRLIHLIDDSFNRKLDVRHYLNRVNDKLAGIIIVGEYEGGALLTWETPHSLSGEDISAANSRLVPYLDKFAVLKRSQGAGGVADILFNAMVRTCFPEGVCWRSRRDNPVNKWYFERARGTWKMPGTNWTMFWTTDGVVENDQTFKDYESVCRGVQPSWADKQNLVD